MKRIAVGILYALAGLALAVGLTAGAYAIAGRDLSRPVRPIDVPAQLAPRQASPTPTPRATRSSDDRGGSRDDNSGSGSNSGPGSDNSGRDHPEDD